MLILFKKLEAAIPNAVADKVVLFTDEIGRASTKDETGNVLTPAVFVDVPSGPTATGTAGTMSYDTNYLYVCVAANTWIRVEKDGTWV